MQTNPFVVDNRHTRTEICRVGNDRRLQREAAVSSARSLDVVFTAYDEELERVEVFKYLGRLLAFDDNDMRAVRANIKKARKSWRMLSRLLRAESIPPRVCGMFFKAEWTYPSSAVVLEEVGLRTIRQYIEVRRQTIAAYIVDRPIFGFCRDGER
ncbi:hypothetical protein ACHAXR_001561, partial [Thalassiosira sp. AJA248-18]